MNNANSNFVLNTNSKFQTDTLIYGHRIILLNILPYPENNKEIKMEDYSVEIEINKE
jgi:hypothetical protein